MAEASKSSELGSLPPRTSLGEPPTTGDQIGEPGVRTAHGLLVTCVLRQGFPSVSRHAYEAGSILVSAEVAGSRRSSSRIA